MPGSAPWHQGARWPIHIGRTRCVLGLPPKKSHAASRPSHSATVVCTSSGRTEHVPTRRQDHDQSPELAALALRVGEKAGGVRSRSAPLLPSEDRRRAPSASAHAEARYLVMSKPPQCRVRDLDPITRKQLAHANEPQRALPAEPSLNPWTLRLEQLVRLGRRRLGPIACTRLAASATSRRRVTSRGRRRTRGAASKYQKRLVFRSTTPSRASCPGALPRPACGGEPLVRRSWSSPKAHRCLPAASRAVADWHRAA